MALSIYQSYMSYFNVEVGDAKSLKWKWRDPGSNPRPLAQQAKSLTTPPPQLPIYQLHSVVANDMKG